MQYGWRVGLMRHEKDLVQKMHLEKQKRWSPSCYGVKQALGTYPMLFSRG